MASMSSLRCFVVVIVSFCAILCSAIAASAGDLVARVGGIPITKYELARTFDEIMPLRGSFHGGVSQERKQEVRDEALSRLIEQALKVRYALAEEISVDNDAVEKFLEPMRAKFKSQKEFEQAIGEEGFTAFRATVYRKLLAERAEQRAVEAKVKVTDDQVKAFYEQNKESYKQPKRFKVSQILVKVDPASNAEEREQLKVRAEDLAARAKSGEDFYNLAYYNSDDRTKYVGGDIGYVHAGTMVTEFEDALQKMKVGEVAGPVKSRFGYHIIHLVEVDEERQLPLDEVKEMVRKTLLKQQRDALYADWLESLRSQYPVERFND